MQETSRCYHCGGEDCVCCEVWLEGKSDYTEHVFYEDSDIDPNYYFNDEDVW